MLFITGKVKVVFSFEKVEDVALMYISLAGQTSELS
jgi:hypothetical protein